MLINLLICLSLPLFICAFHLPVPRYNRPNSLITKSPQSSSKNHHFILRESKETENQVAEVKEPSAFDKVASTGLAGVLAIAAAESIFWALGMPLATIWVKVTTGDWIDLMTPEGQLQAAGFTFGYGGFATVILQYRVTLFAIPLVPIMQRYVVEPGKKYFGDQFGEANGAAPDSKA